MVGSWIKAGLVVLALGGAPPAWAQQGTASVQGVVVDESGAVLPGVTVTARHQEQGTTRTSVTDERGVYRIPVLVPGPYEMTAELSGFQPSKRTDLRLTAGSEMAVDFKMGVGAVSEELTVTGEIALIETTKSHVSTTIDAKQIESMPMLSRDFLQLTLLVPGAGRDTSAVTGRRGIQVGGSDGRYNYTTIIDGGDVDDDVWGSPVQNFMVDGIAEYQVITNRFDAEYGKALEAVVNVVSKGGTNTHRGTGFYFTRDQRLRALTYFEKERGLTSDDKSEFDNKRSGFTIGGPIVRDRIHYFGGYEWVNTTRPVTVNIAPSSPLSVENGVYNVGSTSHLVTMRGDVKFSPNHSLMVRSLIEDNESLSGIGGTTGPSGAFESLNNSFSVLGQETWVISNRSVNDFRFQYRRTKVNNIPRSTQPTEQRPAGTTGSPFFVQQEDRFRYQLYDTLYFNLPRQNIKVGGEVSFTSTMYCACGGQNGRYFFSTDVPFDANNPATWPTRFEQAINLLPTPLDNQYFGMFLQDDWRVTNNFTLNLGIRWDVDLGVRDDETRQAALAMPRNAPLRGLLEENPGLDLDNIDPRVGFAWNATPKTVFRGGYGLHHARSRMFMQALDRDSLMSESFLAVVTDPLQLRNYPDINAILGATPEEYAQTGLRSLGNVIGNSGDFEIPYAHNFSLGLQQQLKQRTSLTVDFVHHQSLKNFAKRVANLPGNYSPLCRAGSACAPWPITGFGQILFQVTNGRTKHDALQIGVTRRMSNRFQGQLSYAYAKTLLRGVNAHFHTPGRASDWAGDRGPSTSDLRHRFAVNAVVELPYGINFSSFVQATSAPAYRLRANADLDGDAQVVEDRPTGLALNQGTIASEDNLSIINAFRSARNLAPVTIEQLGRKDNFFTVDLRAAKDFRIKGSVRTEVMFEAFNLFNRSNFNNPNGTLTSVSFLTVSGTGSPREGRLGIKVRF
jgi:hypothetical protein